MDGIDKLKAILALVLGAWSDSHTAEWFFGKQISQEGLALALNL